MTPSRRRYRLTGMLRRTILALAGAALPAIGLLCAPVAPAAAMGAAGSQLSSSPVADQGSSFHYRSYVRAVSPTVKGLSVQVLEFADRLQLVNHTGQTVTIDGYQREPYARVLADGTAELNTRSPAYYLNKSFYGNVKVPASADPKAAPHWIVVDRTGQFEWHDHRIHWPSPLLPPQVKDKSKRTLVFNWTVPIEVGTTPGAVTGQLYWVPNSSSTPVAAIVVGAIIVLAGLLFVLFVRRRRGRERPHEGEPDGTGAVTSPGREAW